MATFVNRVIRRAEPGFLTAVPPLIDDKDENLEENIDKTAASYIPEEQSNIVEHPETTLFCTCCTEHGLDIDSARGWYHGACKNEWCVECLKKMMQPGLEGNAAFPPSCCVTQLTFEDIVQFLTPNQRNRYEERIALATMSQLLYCAQPRCSSLLGDVPKLRDQTNKFATCSNCKSETCLECAQPKSEHELTNSCPAGSLRIVAEEILLMELGQNEDGNPEFHCRCPCGNIVSKMSGCNFIICLICARELCIRCGHAWPHDCTCLDKVEYDIPDDEKEAAKIEGEASPSDWGSTQPMTWQNSENEFGTYDGW